MFTIVLIICDADERVKPGKSTIWASLAQAAAPQFTLEHCQQSHTRWMVKEEMAEREARKLGKEKGYRFRRYEHWEPYPIKAYRTHWSVLYDHEAEDFETWEAALEWIKGI